MKTHDLAKSLTLMAKILRSSPNVELSEFALSPHTERADINEQDIPSALRMLAALSQFSKQQWVAIIDDHKFSIDVKNTDSVRDVMGKLLRYLASDPNARRILAEKAKKGGARTSPELEEALAILLK